MKSSAVSGQSLVPHCFWQIPWQKESQIRSHEQKREAVFRHSLPPQEQMVILMGHKLSL